jgi:hypothetical protein
MPAAVATYVLAFLAGSMKGLVGRVLIALGLGAITISGFHALTSAVIAQMGFTGVAGQTYAVIDACGIPWLMSTLVSAVTTRLALQGLTSDSLSFWILRRGLPGS